MEGNSVIKSFTDLVVWQQAHSFVLEIYKITKNFPKEELYSLVDQLKRASISVTSNIAEGFSRNSYKEKCQFYYLALGSLTEIQNQLLVAKDVGYITDNDFLNLEEKRINIHRLLNKFISKTKTFI